MTARPMTSTSQSTYDKRPLIAHIVFRFDFGGLENGVVNLINFLPPERFRHAVIALTEASGFQARLARPDISVHALDKRPGKDPLAYFRLFRLLRSLRPAIVHTRNFATLDCMPVARLAGVSRGIHGEHGWDVFDPDGTRRRYRAVRRLLNPMVDRFVAVSREIEQWLTGIVGIRASKVVRICNGVDTRRFAPAAGAARVLVPRSWREPGTVVIGTVARMAAIKDPLNLVRAFIALRSAPGGRAARLVFVGDGDLKSAAEQLLRDAGALEAAWLAGARDDVPQLLREMDVFALGSRREGISNTVLEAMASGLPVVATATGGNMELVRDGESGRLVPPADSAALAAALLGYVADPQLRAAHGHRARQLAEHEYSLRIMVDAYASLYDHYTAHLQETA
jgi:sugar transferase (PEP-CTERM/EpsH1 system associated)